jgi:hypothetical protein
MLQDTFAVEMLLAGVSIDQVSMLLGHSSVKITEKHYPYVGEGAARSIGDQRSECMVDFGCGSSAEGEVTKGKVLAFQA